ncbi:hypothetical protein KIK06_18580 [Nocardiopsis sp. EMB25]|uniref:SecDF P1 head subdomain-containing protein n=1 Tax=Nocardiopsis sp. EMB25 TaxID=2835867 RepID=UPI002283AFDE|nr:hypothetical protein [Nocardiopsis sp. EMB25]MCY9785900.1 hypothetical protein [Nocardiopsis sp. EMB25]
MYPHPPTPRSRGRGWLIAVFAAAALTMIVLAGAMAWVWWSARPGGGETVAFRVGDPTATVSPETVDRVAELLVRRVRSMEAGEPVVTAGGRTVTVELPRDADVEEAVALMERRGSLTVHPVVGLAGPVGEPGAEDRSDAELVLPSPDGSGDLLLGPAALDNGGVASAETEHSPIASAWLVNVAFTERGADTWARMTGEAACHPAGSPERRLAIVVDGEVVTAPELSPDVACEVGLSGGSTAISGAFPEEEASALATLISMDPLPVEVTVE